MNRVLIGCTFLSVIIILAGINRGFDISDEGLYALLAVPEQENIAGIFNYDLFFKLFYKLTGIEFGLVGLRVLRLITCILSAISLHVFWNNYSGSKKFSITIFLICFSGLLASYGFLSQSLSYNSINLMCGSFWLSLISTRIPRKKTYFLLGTTLALLFYAKITVCIILSFLTLIFLIKKSRKNFVVTQLLQILLPFILMEFLFFWFIGETGITRSIAAQEMLNYRPDYNFSAIIKYTLVGVFWCLLVILPFLVAGYLNRIGNSYYWIVVTFGVISLIIIGYFTSITGEINHFVLLLTLALVGFLITASRFSNIKRDQWVLFFLLIIFPFILHFGSNMYWLRLGVHYWVFWLLALLFVIKLENSLGQILFKLVLPLLTLLLVINGVSLYAFNNYNYFEKTQTIEYRDNKFIRLSSKEVDFYSSLKKEVKSSDKQKVLPIFMNPGLVYMIGETSPRTPGVWSKHQFDYFYPTSATISLIFFNHAYQFPFEKDDWRELKSYSIFGDQQIQILRKK